MKSKKEDKVNKALKFFKSSMKISLISAWVVAILGSIIKISFNWFSWNYIAIVILIFILIWIASLSIFLIIKSIEDFD